MPITRRTFCASSALSLSLSSAFAQDASTKQPIRIIVPYPAGGNADSAARAVADLASASLKQTIIVDNRPGGGAQVAANMVKHGPADGSMIFIGDIGAFALNQALYSKLNYNIQKDFAPLARLVLAPSFLVVPADSPLNTMADFNTIMIPTIVQGVAVAFFFIPLTTITLGGLTPDKIPSASGLSSFARMIGGSFGTSIAITVWQSRTALHHAQLAESINRGNSAATSAIAGFGSSGMSQEQVLSQINRMIDQQAAMLAVNDVFYVSAIIFLMLIPLVWLSRPKPMGRSADGTDAAAGAH